MPKKIEISEFITAAYRILLRDINKTITELDPSKYKIPSTYIKSIIEGIALPIRVVKYLTQTLIIF